MALRCANIRKNLSAFLDDELDSRKRKQMELHISECAGCRQETEKLREMIGIIGGMERPEVPGQLWEGTRRKLEAASQLPTRVPVLSMPRWVFVPAAAVVFTLLVYFLGGQLLYKYQAEPVPIAAYVQEHALSYSEQVLPSNPLSELTIAQTELVTEEALFDESISELDMLMEVHYGTYPTNGS
jgi:predicted anti-sigma-YlaC factor YlaD